MNYLHQPIQGLISKTSQLFSGRVSFTFLKKDDPMVKVIPKAIKKSLVFTIDRLQYEDIKNGSVTFNLMGDRIAKLQLILYIKNNQVAHFDDWDQYVSNHLTLDLGKVSFAQQWNATVNLAAQANEQSAISGTNVKEGIDTSNSIVLISPNADGSNLTNSTSSNGSNTNTNVNGVTTTGQLGANAGSSYTSNYTSSLDLNSRILSLSGDMSPTQIILSQEGGPTIDLSRNIVVSLSYVLLDDWAQPVKFNKIKNYYRPDGQPIQAVDLKQSFLTVVFPDIQADVVGNLDYSFLYRQVVHGNRFLPEARQKVKFWYGTVLNETNQNFKNSSIVLIKKEDIRPKGYILSNGAGNLLLSNKELMFENVDEATEFLHYLNDLLQIPSINSIIAVTLNNNPVTQNILNNIKVKTINL